MVELLRELRKTHSPVYCIIKAMIKDADEQPEKKENKVRSGRVLGTGNSVPMESYTLLVYEYVHHPVSSLNLVPLGFCGGFIMQV